MAAGFLESEAYLAAVGRVAVASAYLEDELHRAAVQGLGGTKEAEAFVGKLPGPALIELFRITHGAHQDTAELADRCKKEQESRNLYVHGVVDIVFDGPEQAGWRGARSPFRLRNRKKKGDFDLPSAQVLSALAERLRKAGTDVWIQEEGRAVNFDANAWNESVAG